MQFSAELIKESAEAALDGSTVAEFGPHRIDFGTLNRLSLPEAVAEYWPDAPTRPEPGDLNDIAKIASLPPSTIEPELPSCSCRGVSRRGKRCWRCSKPPASRV